jgi:hypothetical protein
LIFIQLQWRRTLVRHNNIQLFPHFYFSTMASPSSPVIIFSSFTAGFTRRYQSIAPMGLKTLQRRISKSSIISIIQ